MDRSALIQHVAEIVISKRRIRQEAIYYNIWSKNTLTVSKQVRGKETILTKQVFLLRRVGTSGQQNKLAVSHSHIHWDQLNKLQMSSCHFFITICKPTMCGHTGLSFLLAWFYSKPCTIISGYFFLSFHFCLATTLSINTKQKRQ